MDAFRISCIDTFTGGRVNLPASKSLSNRALILRALSGMDTDISNLSTADDTRLLQDLLDTVLKAKGSSGATRLHCENAGTVFRFLTAFLAITPGDWLLTGSERMQERPVGGLVKALNELGAAIHATEKEGYPPLAIRGRKLAGGAAGLDAGVSSQFITALLMIAPTLEKGLSLELRGRVSSRPYIDMTLGVLKHFGVDARLSGNTITVAPQEIRPAPFRIEPDWSAAAFWYEVAALSGTSGIMLEGLKQESLQGDAVLPYLFNDLGVDTSFLDDGVLLTGKEIVPHPVEYDLTDHPDLAQAVIASCAGLGLPGRFVGLGSLRIKETDRLMALQQELAKTGNSITIKGDGELLLSPPLAQPSMKNSSIPVFNPHGDHRMAMALAPLALISGPVVINDPLVVKKSYPGFWDDLRRAGFKISNVGPER